MVLCAKNHAGYLCRRESAARICENPRAGSQDIFKPCQHFGKKADQHSAGLILYYDNMNYINLRKYYSETLNQSALSVICLENGEKTEFLNTRIPVEDCAIFLRLYVQGRQS